MADWQNLTFDEPDENADNIIMLTDLDGKDVPFEFLDCITYQDRQYAILLPPEDSDDSGEVLILEVEPDPEDSELEDYLAVDDDEILSAVYALFRERFQGQLSFTD